MYTSNPPVVLDVYRTEDYEFIAELRPDIAAQYNKGILFVVATTVDELASKLEAIGIECT